MAALCGEDPALGACMKNGGATFLQVSLGVREFGFSCLT